MSELLLDVKESFDKWGLIGGLHYSFWRVYYYGYFFVKLRIWWRVLSLVL